MASHISPSSDGYSEPAAKRDRFSDLSPSNRCAPFQAATPEKTKLVTEYWLRVVSSFAREKDLSIDFKTVSREVLNDF